MESSRRWTGWTTRMAARCTGTERAAMRDAFADDPDGVMDEDRGGDVEVNDRPTEYMGTREAAAFLGLSPRTLDRYRVTGQGPAFHKTGAAMPSLDRAYFRWAQTTMAVE